MIDRIYRTLKLGLRTLAAALTVMMNLSALSIAMAGDVEDCQQKTGAPAVTACTRIIDSGVLGGRSVTIGELVEVYYSRGNALYEIGKMTRAIKDYNQVLDIIPQHTGALNNRGIILSFRGEYDRAISDFNKAVSLDQRNIDAFYNRGNAYAGKRDFERAIRDFNRVLNFRPDDADAYYSRADAHRELGEFDEALDDYDKAVVLNPDDTDARYQRAKLLVDEELYGIAIRDINATLEADPDFAEGYLLRGTAFVRLGQNYRGILDYDKALQVNPKLDEVYFARARAWLKLGRRTNALADFEAASVNGLGDPMTLYRLGESFHRLGDQEQAEATWIKACEAAPKQTIVRWQKKLFELRFYTYTIDGKCGRGTLAGLSRCAKIGCSL